MKFLQQWIKEILDKTVAAIALLILLPVILLISILIYFNLGKPVIFSQLRTGKNGKSFTLYKFRTMTEKKDEQGNLLSDEKRLIPFGQWLRYSSLDELPQLWNILKGEMSLIGPRPLLIQYLDRYTFEQARRHEVKPGLTGWTQINGRNAISWEQKFALDIWYIEHGNLGLDFKILFLTIIKVLQRQGITHQDNVTMPEFWGNQEEK